MTEYMVSPNPCVIVADFDNNAKTVTITMGLFWKTWCIFTHGAWIMRSASAESES